MVQRKEMCCFSCFGVDFDDFVTALLAGFFSSLSGIFSLLSFLDIHPLSFSNSIRLNFHLDFDFQCMRISRNSVFLFLFFTLLPPPLHPLIFHPESAALCT